MKRNCLRNAESLPLRPFTTIAKSAAVVIVLTAVVAIVIAATIPYVIANSRIRDTIGSELSALTGLPVRLNGTVSVSVLPKFVARISDVEFGAEPGPGQFNLRAGSIVVELSWLAAFTRQVEIKALAIDLAEIRLAEDPVGIWLPAPLLNALTPTLSEARAALVSNPVAPDFSTIANWSIGKLVLSNSMLQVINKKGEAETITGMRAEVDWTGANMPAQFTGDGVWRGKEINLSAVVRKPFLAIAGGNSEFTSRLRSEPVQFEFDGVANLQSFFFADGALRFETPSMRQLLLWLGTEIDPGNAMGRLSMAAKLTTKDDHLKFDDVTLEINESTASGVLDLSRALNSPSLSGTLAFEQLDLASFLQAFSIGFSTSPARTGFLDKVQLDLRLSAKAANIGGLPISNLAATARVKDGNADFDLGDATTLGGRVQANLKISSTGDVPNGELRLKASDIDLSQLEHMENLPSLAAPLQFSANLSGKYSGLMSFLALGEGEAEVEIANGQLRNFDISGVRRLLDRGELFNLPDVYEGSVGVKSAKLSAVISKGVAVIKESFFDLEGAKIDATGALPMLTRGLALSGIMTDTSDPQVATKQKFFVGGSWAQPFVTPTN